MMSIVHVVLLIVPILWGFCSCYKPTCQCVYLAGTRGQLWGEFVISSSEIRYNKSECLHIFITGTEQEIIEVRFEHIQLRKGCTDQIHIFPHLREPVLQEPTEPEETICLENSKNFLPVHVWDTELKHRPNSTSMSANVASNNIESSIEDNNQNFIPVTRKQFRIRHRPSIFSSDKVLGMRLIYKPTLKVDAFKIIGRFQFIDKGMFRNDGNLVATTYCDYQFLPHPINYGGIFKNDVDLWRYFHSPRYPAKYPDHIKCTYKFIGRPRNRVEVLFEEIYLLTGHSSCLHHSDKITVYDSKIPDMSSIIDVFCNENPGMGIISSGPNLLIEFEASSNRTSNGFSAKYRFVDIFPIVQASKIKASDILTNESLVPTVSTTTSRSPTDILGTSSTYKSDSIKGLSKHLKQLDDNHWANNGLKTTSDLNNTKTLNDSGQMTPTASTNDRAGNSVRLCPPGSHCDKILSSKSAKNGTIQTPMFPGPYPVRTLCRYEFQGQGRERIQIKFFEFTLPSEGDSYDCEEADTLQILLPIRGRYEPVETLCGDTMPKPIMSNGPKMMLEFRGRHSGKGNRGFKAEYKFLENFGIISGKQIPDAECTFQFNSSEERSGWFHSPNFPGAYPRNIECNYLFYGELFDRVFIRFTYFDVEGIFPCEESSASDYVEFSNFMSIDRKFRRFCGKRSGFPVRSDGRFFRITFRTNDRFDKTGFRASYSFEAEPPTTESSYTSIQEIDSANSELFCIRLAIVLPIFVYLIRGIANFL